MPTIVLVYATRQLCSGVHILQQKAVHTLTEMVEKLQAFRSSLTHHRQRRQQHQHYVFTQVHRFIHPKNRAKVQKKNDMHKKNE